MPGKVFSIVVFLMVSLVSLQGQQIETASIDPRAAAVIDRALAAMGGADAWRGMQAAQLQGNVEEVNGQTREETHCRIVVQHDWSSGQFQSSHALTDGQGQSINSYDPDKMLSRMQAEAVKGQPRQPGTYVLPALLPGALLSTALTSGQYRITADPHPERHRGSERMIAMFRAGGLRQYWPEQVWTFSAETGLPLRARIAIPGRNGTLHKFLTFNDFRKSNSLLVPGSIEILYPDGVKQVLTFDQSRFVPAVRGMKPESSR